MEHYKKKKYVVNIILLFMIILLAVLIIPFSRSLLSAKIYKEMNKKKSVLYKEEIDFHIPSGVFTGQKDWFPIMVWFHHEGEFYLKKGYDTLDLTVLYSYGDFDSLLGTSTYYDEQSLYYGAFYGGYAIKNISNPNDAFGFDHEGNIIPDEIQHIPLYDQKFLVLPALGCENDKRVFGTQIMDIRTNLDYAGYKEWTCIDSIIYTNGPAHEKSKFQIGYLQYGMPLESIISKTDFSPHTFWGRMYVKYFDEYQITFCLYVMCKDIETVKICDKELLSYTRIGKRD